MTSIKLFQGFNEDDNKAIKEEFKKFGIKIIIAPPSMAFADLPLIYVRGEKPPNIHGKEKIFRFIHQRHKQ